MKFLIYRDVINLTKVLMSFFSDREVQLNSVTIHNNKYEGKFVRANVNNLSSSDFSKDGIYLIQIELKFVPTPKHINLDKIKQKIKVYDRKQKLMWHFSNDHRKFDVSLFERKCKFNPKQDATIEMYLSCL